MPEKFGLHFDTQEELDAALARLGAALERINEAERRAWSVEEHNQ